MIFDKTLLFSDAQAITATAVSTNVVDLLATGRAYGHAANIVKDVGKGNAIPLHIQVVEAFNTLTSLTVTVQCDDNEAFSSAKNVVAQTIPLAELVAGKTASILVVPPGVDERYLRLNYTVTGTNPTTGKITAGVVMASQTNAVDF
jgi:hypothetical protein